MPVRQMRLVVTAEDYEAAVHFYRDVLGMPELGAFAADGGFGPFSTQVARRSSSRIRDTRHTSIGSRWASASPGISAWRSRWTTHPARHAAWKTPARG